MNPTINLSISVFFFAFIGFNCSPKNISKKQTPIPIKFEKIQVLPINNNAQFTKLKGWPKEVNREKILLKNIDMLQQELIIHLRSIEKHEHFTVVGEMDKPTIEISLTLEPFLNSKNVIYIPIKLHVIKKPEGIVNHYTIPTRIILPTLSEKGSYYQYNAALISYYKDFPYQKIIDILCSESNKSD